MAEKKNPYAGTQTEKNLLAALAGESEATNKYTYFASRAKKDGYEQIAALFLKTASNEREHAKLWFKELFGIGTTAENLLSAAETLQKKQAQEEAASADPEIDALVAQRTAAKKAKNFAEADRIREELKARGIEIIDTPQGAKWRKV